MTVVEGYLNRPGFCGGEEDIIARHVIALTSMTT